MANNFLKLKNAKNDFLPYFIKHHYLKTQVAVEVYFCAFLTSSIDGGYWPASCSDRFTSVATG
jgi:hypothetical protein